MSDPIEEKEILTLIILCRGYASNVENNQLMTFVRFCVLSKGCVKMSNSPLCSSQATRSHDTFWPKERGETTGNRSCGGHLPFSLSLCLCLSVSLPLSLYLYLSLSRSFCCVSLFSSLSPFLLLCLSVSLSLSLSLSPIQRPLHIIFSSSAPMT